MDDLQIRMIENQAAAIAVDALNSGDLMICQLANDALALVAEMKSLRAKLDAVPVYVAGVVGAAPLVSFEDFYTFVTGIGTDTDTSADGLVIPDDGGDE